MINFKRGSLFGVVFAIFALSACNKAESARTPERLQGIVEHDQRILAFEVGGRVASLPVDRGSAVTAGQVLGVLDDGMERPLRDAREAERAAATAQLELVEAGPRGEEIRAARAQLTALDAQRDLAQRSLDRQLVLATSGASASAQRDAIDGTLATLNGQREAARQQLLALRRGARSEEVAAAEARVEAATAALRAIDARLHRGRPRSSLRRRLRPGRTHARRADRHARACARRRCRP
jgi:multidrug resistance efflux pump